MSKLNNIDMFKNDVRYRENIAHIETIPAKEASFKKVEDLDDKILQLFYIGLSFNWDLSLHR